ncbi:MAG: cadherin-like domain-containing protein, partial [Anaerolineae bacterium]|nr:cadherin-like domain-containing protein [Anaerolineae bacterium]
MSLVLALILSAAGMETAHAAPLFDPVLPSGLNGNGPGGVGTTDGSSALELWLRPDRGVYTDNLCSVAAGNGSAVYCWADQSGNGANATQATTANRPLYYTTTAANLINGQPTIRLDGNNDYFNVPVSVIQGRTAFSFFTAFRWNAASNWQRLWDFGQSEARNGFVTARYNTSNRPRFAITTGGGTAEQQLTFSSALPTGSGQIIDVIWGPNPKTGWRNGANQALGNYTLTPNNLGTITQNYIGRSIYPDPYLNANMGEFIVFSTALNDTNRILVDNYLCSKYDVTLSANDVYTGDIPANGNFDLDVAGIGQLGGSQHTASHAAGIIVVNNTFLNANGDWLLFGHNTAANSTTTADLPSSTWGSRWSRAWYMDLTDAGTTGGTVNIIFDYSDSGLGGTPTYPVGAYRLLSRAGTSGQFTDVTTASGATVSIDGDQVQFLGVNVSPLDGLTFTLGVYTPPDLALIKAVTPASAAPGQTITYTLVFSNAGIGAATDVVITDTIPVSVTNTSVSSSGVAITETAPGYVWAVADLAPGVGGVITVTGVLSEPLAAGVFTNTAVITGTGDSNPANNASSAGLTVLNVAPVANDNGYSTAEDTSLTVAAPGVLTNDTDANGDPMSAVLVDTVPVSAGALTLNADGSLTYTPTLDFNGVVTFTYYAYDGELASNTATVTLTITPVNDAPAFTSAPVTAA